MYYHKEWMKDIDHKESYWRQNGKYQNEACKLYGLVPITGAAKDPLIEVWRHVGNFYYDRYNNGHCNPCRTKEAEPVRRFMKKHKAPKDLKFKIGILDSELEKSVDWIVQKITDLREREHGQA